MRRTASIVSIALVLTLAGCIGSGSLKSNGATLTYSGKESGEHEESTKCDGSGHISGSGNVEDGSVHVVVTTESGEHIFDKTYSGSADQASTEISGRGGTWTIKATRSGDDLLGDSFNGNYRFVLTC